jgi:hypothetical protein
VLFIVYSRTMPFGALASSSTLLQLAVVHLEEGEIMSCHASIRRHFPDPSITIEDTRERSLARESRPGSILILAGFRTEVETQLVIDRLLSEYFTPESRQA